MKKSYILIVIALVSCELFASGGSVYTRFGLGDIYNNRFARRMGFGGLGASVADAHYIGIYNPAGWYKLGVTRFETGLNVAGIKVRDRTGSSDFSDVSFSGFAFGFPIDSEYGISIVGGLMPYSKVSYDIRQNTNKLIPGIDTINYNANYYGNGGLSSVFIGSSYKLPFDFIIGASFSYYFGKIEYNSESDFPDGSVYQDAYYQRKYSYHGIGTTLGIISSDFSNLFGMESIKDLRLGLVLTYLPKLHTDTTLLSTSVIGSNSIENGITETKIPIKVGFGVSFIYDEDYLFLIDYLYQPWKNYEYNNANSRYLRDLQKVSVGFEYENSNPRFDSFWEQIKYRCGLSYEETQYRINGVGIDQYSAFAGITLPVTNMNSIDIGLQYSIRGQTKLNLEKDNYFGASVSISLGELWFIRQER